MPEIMGVPGEIVLIFISIAMIAIQFFTCWKWDNILIWLIPTVVNIICVIVFFVIWTSCTEKQAFDDWGITLLCSLATLGADILGWGLWWLWNFVQNRGSENPAGY